MMTNANNPIYLFADSRLFFWQDRCAYCLEPVTQRYLAPQAAYIGASNGNEPAFYAIFAAAMETIGIQGHRMIDVTSSADRDYLATATIIVLAGGSVEIGWRAFVKSGVDRLLVERYAAGATLVGISAPVTLFRLSRILRAASTACGMPSRIDGSSDFSRASYRSICNWRYRTVSSLPSSLSSESCLVMILCTHPTDFFNLVAISRMGTPSRRIFITLGVSSAAVALFAATLLLVLRGFAAVAILYAFFCIISVSLNMPLFFSPDPLVEP